MENKINDLKIKRVFKKLNINDVSYVSTIYGGMSNFTYIYKSIDKKYAVHVSKKGYDLFVKRDKELDACMKLKNNEYVQKEIYLSNNVRIFEYIDGVSMNEMDYKNHYEEISLSLKSFHASPLFKYDYDPFLYLESLVEMNKDIKDELYLNSLKILYDNYDLLSKRPLCPCHNDYQPSNLILNNNKVYILDLEFSGNNDYLFDIATFGNIDFNDSLNLLKIYNPNYSSEDVKVLTLWRIYVNTLWFLVASKKDKMGYSKKLKLDFKEIGYMFLNRNVDLLKSLN